MNDNDDSTVETPRFVLNHSYKDRQLASFNSAPHLLENYTLVNPDGSSLSANGSTGTVVVPPLGEGSFGVVYRAQDPLQIPRAVKVFVPEDLGMAGETTSYKREIQLANAKPYKNVIRIMNYGIRPDSSGRQFGCYVMDFVNGRSLAFLFHRLLPRYWDAILSDSIVRQQAYVFFFDILDQLVRGIVELHEASVVHMDVKPANALVELDSVSDDVEIDLAQPRKLFLTDLGASKKVGNHREGRTTLVRTRDYFPEHLLGALEQQGVSISYQKLNKHGFYIDLYALGRTIEDLVFDRYRRQRENRTPAWHGPWLQNQEQRKEKVWRTVLAEEFEMLEMVVDDLVSQRPSARYTRSSAVARALTKISRRDSSDLRTSIMLTDRYSGLEIKVAQELVRLAPPLATIVEHPVFQRLRQLPQLGLISQIFPGATHTRFAHSLLTFNRAKQFLMSLSQSAEFRYLFGPPEIDRLLAAALLHDIGQYPFAHGIEDLRRGAKFFGVDYWQQIKYDHEVMPTMLEAVAGGTSISRLLAGLGIDPSEVAQIVAKKREVAEDPAMMLSREIINGTIDVDRISYLKFDSDMSGVPYGKGIDVDSLIRNLRVRFLPGTSCSLAVEEDGVSSAEMLLATIYWMYRNVYWHPSNRKIMVVLKYVFNKLLKHGALSFDEYLAATMWGGDRSALQLLAERFDKLGSETCPLGQLLEGGRLRYRRLLEIGEVGTQQSDVYNQLLWNADPETVDSLCHLVGTIIDPSADGSGRVLWDIPLKPRLREEELGRPAITPDGGGGTEAATAVRLWVRLRRAQVDKTKRWERIEEYSGLARQIMAEEDRQGRKIRVFVSEEFLEKAGVTASDLHDLERRALDAVAAHVRDWKVGVQTR